MPIPMVGDPGRRLFARNTPGEFRGHGNSEFREFRGHDTAIPQFRGHDTELQCPSDAGQLGIMSPELPELYSQFLKPTYPTPGHPFSAKKRPGDMK